jgi:hypothetical protein
VNANTLKKPVKTPPLNAALVVSRYFACKIKRFVYIGVIYNMALKSCEKIITKNVDKK